MRAYRISHPFRFVPGLWWRFLSVWRFLQLSHITGTICRESTLNPKTTGVGGSDAVCLRRNDVTRTENPCRWGVSAQRRLYVGGSNYWIIPAPTGKTARIANRRANLSPTIRESKWRKRQVTHPEHEFSTIAFITGARERRQRCAAVPARSNSARGSRALLWFSFPCREKNPLFCHAVAGN